MALLDFIRDSLKTGAHLVYIMKCFVSGPELKPKQSPVGLLSAMIRDYKVLVREVFSSEQMMMFALLCKNRLNQEIRFFL